MPLPVMTICESGSTVSEATEYDDTNRISFADAQKGVATDILTVDVWNDRDGLAGSDDAPAPAMYATNDDDVSVIFDGTELNGFESMLECRSCLGFNTPSDQQSAWTKVKPGSPLIMGNMPSQSKRTVEMRLNVPADADTLSLRNFRIFISA